MDNLFDLMRILSAGNNPYLEVLWASGR